MRTLHADGTSGSSAEVRGAGADALARRRHDVDLAARCVSGDASAQRELFERERAHIHATLFRVVGSNVEMEDLIQDAFAEVYRSLRSYRGEANLRTWIDRCTVRIAYAHFARKPRWPRLATVTVEPRSASGEAQILAREATRRLYAELGRLDPKQRLAFALHVIDGRPMKEVAALMDSSLVATKSRVWRARRAIESRARQDDVLADFLAAPGEAEEDGGA